MANLGRSSLLQQKADRTVLTVMHASQSDSHEEAMFSYLFFRRRQRSASEGAYAIKDRLEDGQLQDVTKRGRVTRG